MYIFIFIAGIIIDQITKLWAISYLKNESSVTIIKGWLNLTYVENSGAAFGIFKDATIVFTVLTIVICLGIVYYLLQNFNKIDIFFKLPLVMIMSGAIGNLIDRLRLGYVVDFIHTPLGGLYNFPVFNFADIFITLSAFALIIIVYFYEGKNV